jgi:biotin carboxyl carrier protein
MPYKITSSNPSATFDINPADIRWDLQQWKPNQFHIVINGQAHNATVIETDYKAKTFKIAVNNRIYELQLQDELDQLSGALNFGNAAAKKHNIVKAPMPGLVLSVLVSEGATVKKGDSLLILEAMKMENIIKAPTDASIKSIKVVKGQSVEKNQLLIEFV